jgi:regulator of nonsense transcripts 3
MFSRAFLNFNSPEAVFDFKARFDGHVFVSTRGTQYRCSVEYAPFQKVPTAHPKKLAMEGTIDKGRLPSS